MHIVCVVPIFDGIYAFRVTFECEMAIWRVEAPHFDGAIERRRGKRIRVFGVNGNRHYKVSVSLFEKKMRKEMEIKIKRFSQQSLLSVRGTAHNNNFFRFFFFFVFLLLRKSLYCSTPYPSPTSLMVISSLDESTYGDTG